jgi:hypothetical protein
MSSPEATSDLTCRLNDVCRPSDLEDLKKLPHGGGMVNALAQEREHLIA